MRPTDEQLRETAGLRGGSGASVPDAATYPLTPLQNGMLFHTIRAGHSGPYVEQFVFDVEGDVDQERLTAAWNHVLLRHPVLRTTFAWEGLDEPLQTVRDDVRLAMREHELGSADADFRTEDEFLAADRAAGFDLTEAPLMRLTLLRGGSGASLVWTLHHLIIDGWSMPLVLADVVAAYRAGTDPAWERAKPYGDFVRWLRAQPYGESAEKFWRRRLKGFQPPARLVLRPGATRVADVAEEGEAGTVHRDLPERLSKEVAASARAARVTPATWFQGVWALALARLTGDRDVVFGITISGRPAELDGVEQVVGPMINTLPQRIVVDETAVLLQWLRSIQRDHFDMEPFQHTGLTEIQGWSEVPAGSPLFETLFVFENYPDRTTSFALGDGGALSLRRIVEDTGYPLTFMVMRQDTGTRLQLLYDEGVVSRAAAATLLERVEHLLTTMTAGVEKPLAGMGLTTPSECDLALRKWNRTDTVRPDRSVHRMVREQALRTPDRPALQAGGRRLTYRELMNRSESLARVLTGRGIGPDSVVALFQGRTVEVLVSLLAVLRAGAAFVALDPDNPDARLSHVLRDSGAALLLSEEKLEGRLHDPGIPRLLVDRALPSGDGTLHEEENLDCLAYITYTSGSTGVPKGIAMSHRAVANLILWQLSDSSNGHQGTTFAYASLSFDASFQEIFGTWCAGGMLALVDDEGRRDFENLPHIAARDDVVRWYMPTAALHQVAKSAAATGTHLSSLLEIMPGGEALQITPEVRRLFKGAPRCRLDNYYGPSECHVVTSHTLEGHPDEWPEWPAIGRPIRNTRIYLLDDMLRPVPVGVAGFLHIGGIGVARGYVNRPGTTAEKFLPDPFGGVPGARMYATGDRAYQDPDGLLHFIGRVDNQVKIRGHRVELGEVEAALCATGLVQEAVVLVHGTEDDRRLAAYVVCAQAPLDEEAFSAALRDRLRTSLPEYMVPWSVTVLPRMPLTVSRKIDRKALPAPRPPAVPTDGRPRHPAAVLMLRLWSEALGAPGVDFDGDFFRMGGHSMIALRLIGRVRQAFGVRVGLGDLLDSGTPRRLLARVEAELGGPEAADRIARGRITDAADADEARR